MVRIWTCTPLTLHPSSAILRAGRGYRYAQPILAAECVGNDKFDDCIYWDKIASYGAN